MCQNMVERRGERWYFAGRRNGVINVGGLKVHPEEVEAVLNDHPAVRMSLVRARKNPITGAVVTADVALVDPDAAATPEAQTALRDAILSACRAALPPTDSTISNVTGSGWTRPTRAPLLRRKPPTNPGPVIRSSRGIPSAESLTPWNTQMSWSHRARVSPRH